MGHEGTHGEPLADNQRVDHNVRVPDTIWGSYTSVRSMHRGIKVITSIGLSTGDTRRKRQKW